MQGRRRIRRRSKDGKIPISRSRVSGHLFSAALTAFVAAGASADPVNVEYFVVRKDFNAQTRGTDVLTFELFSDAGCTTLVDTENLFANDTVLR
jgi:hypothetical protein